MAGGNWRNEPLKHLRSDSSITNRRKLTDELCLPKPGTSKSKCDSVEGHIKSRFKDILGLVMRRVLYLDDQAYIRFKTELEKDKELHDTYEAKRQERWRYRKSRKLGKAVNETGQPPKGYRRLTDDEKQMRDEDKDTKS